MLIPARQRPTSQSGFSLVELLLVVGILVILAGMGYGVATGVADMRARTQARAELAVLEQALEQFKLRYGDYPPIAGDPLSESNAEDLFGALTGRLRMSWDEDADAYVLVDAVPAGPVLIDAEVMRTPDPDEAEPSLFFLDPWGQPYCYLYNRESGSWDKFGYLLLCHGPDRDTAFTAAMADTGLPGDGFASIEKNKDTILVGQ